MSLPAHIRGELEAEFGPCRVDGTVGGGCIHPAWRLETRAGLVFLKYGRRSPPGFFAAEADGLRQLAAATTLIRVPEVLHFADSGPERTHGWIALEWLEPGRRAAGYAERLAQGMAELHSPAPGGWGWDREGFIGTLPQDNGTTSDWPTFWGTRRLAPQLRRARAAGRLPATEQEWSALTERLPELLGAGDDDGPSLLHGDLWAGNILATAAGEPAIVDPATYRGHCEVDLAMSQLFGGLDDVFYREYEALRPLQPGFRERRLGIYQLYYLLVHVNLFGEGYLAQTATTLRSVLGSI